MSGVSWRPARPAGLFLIPSDVAQALGGLATMAAACRQGGDVSAGGAPPTPR
ncbi:MAG TPA: hypothetical protein VFD90_18325 [Gaiellales bacterium]|nr:hypothetical protein [Gaiellales bacterium]